MTLVDLTFHSLEAINGKSYGIPILKQHSKLVGKSCVFLNPLAQSLAFVIFSPFTGSSRRFSTHVWQNARVNNIRRATMCDVYFPFTKTL